MRSKYIFHNDHYYYTLKSQIGKGEIPVYHGSRQRGGGIGSVLGGIAKYAFPLVMKYIFPHVKRAASSVISDVVNNRSSVKQSLKKGGQQFLKDFAESVGKQSGEGILPRGLKRRGLSSTKSNKQKKPRKTTSILNLKKQSKKKKKSVRKPRRTKLDIFD
jgi:hypothetical protein